MSRFCDKDHPQDIFWESDGRSTYNHLVNAVLRNPKTKLMYFTRLKTLLDKYLHGGSYPSYVDLSHTPHDTRH